jgi:hypothetical protein
MRPQLALVDRPGETTMDRSLHSRFDVDAHSRMARFYPQNFISLMPAREEGESWGDLGIIRLKIIFVEIIHVETIENVDSNNNWSKNHY